MKLYLHIGTEKTGSSFLQSYLAKNRLMLKSHSLYFPDAGKRENDMQSGRISPGNASELNALLSQKSWLKVEHWMKNKYKAAKTDGCTKLLLSNETLIKTFSETDVLARFIEIAKEQGFELQDLFLVIREPVGQALSLYKHRSKNGDMLPIADWLRHKYTLVDDLQNFYQNIETAKIGLRQYPYQKNSEYLVDICINKWLNLNEDVGIEHTSVNSSLTLSELKLMSEIKKQDAFLVKPFYDFMIAIAINQKSDDFYLKSYYKYVTTNYLIKYIKLWQRCNSYMTKGKIVIPEAINKIVDQEFVQYCFSETQISEISRLLNSNNNKSFRKEKLKENLISRLKNLLPKSIIKLLIKIKS
jgi:hypothetical protein